MRNVMRTRQAQVGKRSKFMSDTTRVVVINHSANLGGAELALLRFASRAGSGYKFAVLESGELKHEFEKSSLDERTTFGPGSGFLMQVLECSRVLSRNPRVPVLANSTRAAVIVSLLAGRRRRQIFYVRDGLDRQSMGWAKRALLRWTVMRTTTGYLANSLWTKGTITDVAPSANVHVVHTLSGIGPNDIGSVHPPHSPVRILSLSRLVPWKGIDTLIQALELLASEGLASSFECTIAGDPRFGTEDYVRECKRRAHQSGVKINFVGHVSDVGSLLNESDVLVHASRRPEPFGQVVVQGLAHGLLTIATKEGGPSELIEDGVNGMLFSPGNSSDLAAALRKSAQDVEAVEMIRTRAAGSASAYSDLAVVKRIEEGISSILSN